MSSLQGKVALVTGGANGLGAATAVALRERGAELVLVDVDDEAGIELADELAGHFFHGDVSEPEQNQAMVEFARERCGGLDLIHLNAGVSSGMGLDDDFDLDRYRRIMATNLDSVVLGLHYGLPALRERGGGAVVATSSLAGLTGVGYDPLYSANKHAVVGLVRSLGPLLVADEIRLNAVCPGFAETAIIAPFRDELVSSDVPIIPPSRVAEAAVALFEGEMSGECWFVQAGRPAEAFAFRGIPGPRAS